MYAMKRIGEEKENAGWMGRGRWGRDRMRDILVSSRELGTRLGSKGGCERSVQRRARGQDVRCGVACCKQGSNRDRKYLALL